MDMSGNISERALDVKSENAVVRKLQDLASTGASAQWLSGFFENAITHEVPSWQVGEAIAHVVLERGGDVIFPWNTKRDERNPRANLQGADLVGISIRPQERQFVFGEVKSSSEDRSPPAVMSGESGMGRQLERLIDNPSLLFWLIKWLGVRVRDAVEAAYDEALTAFVTSNGASIRFIGMLVRDTSPNENDVRASGRTLDEKVSEPGSVELHALYMPRPMREWTQWVTT